ncbi:hypothetical protein QZN29_02860 [Burkholderia multivorans]|uniref:hypothetical protein n=1 Tax=Burkholderia multivorans TaxID=87883 RepID=UPI0011B2931B|nr:hypothetical protein [Burkholderia multivorans]MCA8263308.1 hypothetical protein [Burkholderia multivorans]MDN7884817.1 hypothetical protein [Burkholderia multivorans]MDN7974628.1 hypothetical protein [Burkholderia multivorans]MDN7981232.1 hypothetical protein [Burkholderia multivorans]MDN7986173.1 hypothetical protein [Burkholderia multivorans]
MNKLYAIVENGVITNMIIWDGNTNVETGGWEPPAGAAVAQIQEQPQIGWSAVETNGTWTFVKPEA